MPAANFSIFKTRSRSRHQKFREPEPEFKKSYGSANTALDVTGTHDPESRFKFKFIGFRNVFASGRVGDPDHHDSIFIVSGLIEIKKDKFPKDTGTGICSFLLGIIFKFKAIFKVRFVKLVTGNLVNS